MSYEGQIAETVTIVGHGFFATDRPNYRQAQAVDGWQKVFGFYERYLWESGEARGARAYLESRGLDRPALEEFGVGFAPSA